MLQIIDNVSNNQPSLLLGDTMNCEAADDVLKLCMYPIKECIRIKIGEKGHF